MKKLLLTSTLALTALCHTFASIVTSSTAQTVALTYFKGISGNTASNLSATLIYTKAESNQTADFYVFNISPIKGFVIVSADDNAEPVIAYSTESNFSTDFSRIGLSDWMTSAAAKINNIVTNKIVADSRITTLWISYEQGVMTSSSRSTTVAPLVSTTWNQYPYYNLFCPYNSTDAQTCVTGCVATAMAQIMKFWNYPTHGTGSYSYTDAPPSFSYNYGVQSANFGTTTYNWAAMPIAVTGPTNDTAVATLMYQCGVAVAMDYGDLNEGGSGAYVTGGAPSAQSAYSTYFSYNASTLQGVSQSSYTSTAWISLLQNELNAGRPIQYEGFDPSAGGHTWVCDGYDANSNFHMNWGWGGYDNGYYSLTSLSAGGYTFNTNDAALIGIQPSTSASCGVAGGLTSSSITSSSATVSWSAVSGASSYNVQYKASTASTWTTVSVSSATTSLTGLASGTTYNYQVQTVCSGGSSAYSAANTFTTTTGCGAAGSPTVSTITTSGATLSWGAVTGATSYNLEYKTSSATSWTTVSVTSATYNISGLTAGTTYDYQVATVCSSGTSTYSSPSTFTTLSNCGMTSNVAASAITSSTATVSWTAVSGATSYTLEYKLGSSSTWSTFSLSGTSVNFSSLSPGTTYNFAVQTVCSSGTSAYTTASSFTTLTSTSCGVPTGLTSSSITTGSATVSWSAVSGATSYNLEYKTSTAGTWTTLSVKGASTTLTGLNSNTVYDYQVQTVCSSGSSAFSAATTFTTLTPSSCGVPSGLASSALTTTSATVSWTAVTGATSYTLEYKTSAATIWTTVSVSGTSQAFTGLTAGTVYDYQVQTVCSSGSSAYSATSTFTTATTSSCGVTTGLNSSAVTTTTASVSWTAVTGATSYVLEYKLSSSSTWSTFALSGTMVNFSNLSPETTYDYAVQTVCPSGSSAYSSASSFTTLAPASCGVATGLTAGSITSTGATVNWTAVTGATSYNLGYKSSAAITWTTVSVTGTSHTLTGLTANTTYDYQVQTVCSSGSSAYSSASTLTTTEGTTAAYCAIKGTSTFEYINSVTFGSFTNTSGNNSGYGNYTSLTVPMPSGSKISFTLTPGFASGSFKEYFVIYIDYNNNGEFTDAGEQVFASTGSTGATTGSFTVPAGLSGTARMRIIMQYNSDITSPCGTYSWGEAEDYTVNFSATSLHDVAGDPVTPTIDWNVSPAPWIYPNPVSTTVHVLIVPVEEIQTRIDILSITGQVVSTYIPGSGDRQADMDVSTLAPGVYIVRTEYGEDRVTNAKMIKL